MLWTRTERLNPLGCMSPTDLRDSRTGVQIPANTRSVTSTCHAPASEHRRAARLVTSPRSRSSRSGPRSRSCRGWRNPGRCPCPDRGHDRCAAERAAANAVDRVADFKGHAYGALGCVIAWDGIVEEHHDAVSGEPLEGAFVGVHQTRRWPGGIRSGPPSPPRARSSRRRG